MKRILAACPLLALVLALPAFALEDGQVLYIGGTAAALKEGVFGRLNTTSPALLIFETPESKLAISFDKIDSYEYSQQLARHLGVLPAVAVGLIKRRQRKHYLRISYHDEANAPQVAIFELPKQMPRSLLAILQLRAPQGCKPRADAKCIQLN